MSKITTDLPPRGEPTGGFKNYSDCDPGMSVTCCRPDCVRCHSFMAQGRHHMTEEALVLARFYQEVSKQLFMSHSAPGRIKAIHAHFDPAMNAHASCWNWTRIEGEVKALVKKFWDHGKSY